MNIEELEKKAEDLKKAVRFAYTHRRPPVAAISNPSDSASLTMIEMLDVIRVDIEAGDSSRNISKGALDEIYDDFLKVVSISSHIPVSKAVRGALQVKECTGHILARKEAFDGLSEEFVIREFPWRFDRLVCGLYSLPIKVNEEDPKWRRRLQGAS